MFFLLPLLSLSASAVPQGPCETPFSWWEARPQAGYDGDNCHVAPVPIDEEPFIHANHWYVAAKATDCPLGWFDGMNCYLGSEAPARWEIPEGSQLFRYNGNWYLTPLPSCTIGNFDGANCWLGTPPRGATAFLWDDAFYYSYADRKTSETGVLASLCGDSYAPDDLDGCMNETLPPQPSVFRGISKADADYAPGAYRSVRTALGFDDTTFQADMGPPVDEDAVTTAWHYGQPSMGKVQAQSADRSTNDGRISLVPHWPGQAIRVLHPETLGYDDVASSDLPFTSDLIVPLHLLDPTGKATNVTQADLCDASGDSIVPGALLSDARNPRACSAPMGAGDCYDVTLLYSGIDATAGAERWWLRSLDVTLFVSNAKTPHAAPHLYPRTPATVLGAPPSLHGPSYDASRWAPFRSEAQSLVIDVAPIGHLTAAEHWDGDVSTTSGALPADQGLSSGVAEPPFSHRALALFEPSTTANGRTLIVNTMRGLYYATNTGRACAAEGFTHFAPVSHMPFDPLLTEPPRFWLPDTRLDIARVGQATGGFRDPNGRTLEDGEVFIGAYAWIDRQGKNLFWSPVNVGRATYRAAETWPRRPDGTSGLIDENNPDVQPGKGVAVLGSWTQGKTVVLDNLLNATDFGGAESRAGTGFWIPEGGQHAGNSEHRGGRFARHSFSMPLYQGENMVIRPGPTRMINSPEHVFNYLDALSPTLPFDVVWRMTSGNGRTAEVAFDEYMNNQAFVVAHMNATQRREVLADEPRCSRPPCAGARRLLAVVPHDGFTHAPADSNRGYGNSGFDFAFTENPRLQNATTAHPAFGATLTAPTSLRLRGGARIEPVAQGGVLGKGVYLDGVNDFIDMGYPRTHHANWYYGIWLDSRDWVADRGRTVFFWADSSRISLSRTALVIHNGATGAEVTHDLGALGIDQGDWMHLGVAVVDRRGARVVTVFLNGNQVTTAAFPGTGNVSGFSMDGQGSHPWSWFTVGDPGIWGERASFRGWVDELRIYPLPGDVWTDPAQQGYWTEFQCNLALGTMRQEGRPGLSMPGETVEGPYCEQLQLQSHATPTELGPQVGYAVCADRVHRNADPSLSHECLRPHLLKLQPLMAGTPRPEDRDNAFCLSCHRDENPIAALQTGALAAGRTSRECDARRQPMDWPAVLSGQSPPGISAPQSTTCPAAPTGAGAFNADLWFDLYGKITP